MANFLKLTSQTESRLGQYATRLFRVEAHLRQGERRAARRRLEGFADELEEFERELEFPLEMMIVGGQLGFFSGKGSVLRGRLPGAILGTVAGWFFGQSTACSYREAIDELKLRVRVLEIELLKQSQEGAAPPSADESEAPDEEPADEKVAVGDEPKD